MRRISSRVVDVGAIADDVRRLAGGSNPFPDPRVFVVACGYRLSCRICDGGMHCGHTPGVVAYCWGGCQRERGLGIIHALSHTLLGGGYEYDAWRLTIELGLPRTTRGMPGLERAQQHLPIRFIRTVLGYGYPTKVPVAG